MVSVFFWAAAAAATAAVLVDRFERFSRVLTLFYHWNKRTLDGERRVTHTNIRTSNLRTHQ